MRALCLKSHLTQFPLAIAIASAFLPVNFQAFAQQSSASRGPAVVVTATRNPTRVNELTSDVTLIEREEIERSGPTLREVLRTVPGVEVVQTGGPGTGMTVLMRGTNSDHVLVLVDGMRMSSATLGTAAFENIPLDQIERIEILRGPASSLYGSAALGGVIQIFTRAAKGPNASVSYGSYGTTNFSAGTGFDKDGWRLSVQLSGTDSTGFTQYHNPAGGFGAFNPDADGYRNGSFSGLLAKRFGQSEVGIRTFYSHGRTRFDNADFITFDPAGASFDYQNHLTQTTTSLYGQTRIGERWRTRLTLATSLDNATSENFPPNPRSRFKTSQDQLTWQNDVTLPVGSLTLALESLQERVDATTAFLANARDTDSVLAGYQANLGKHSFQLSGRHDAYTQIGSKNTGYVGYGYALTSAWRVTAGAGTAFKVPTFNQLYFPAGFGCPAFGNPNLRPESARNIEGGVRYAGGTHSGGVVGFHNDVRDLITGVPIPGDPFGCQQAQNVSRAKIEGLVFDYAYSGGEWTLSGNANFQSPEDRATGNVLPRRAKRFFTVGARRALLGGRAGVELHGVSARYDNPANTQRMGGYGLVNAFFEMPLGERNWTAFARAENLGNKGYETARDFNVPGRSLFVGVRYLPE